MTQPERQTYGTGDPGAAGAGAARGASERTGSRQEIIPPKVPNTEFRPPVFDDSLQVARFEAGRDGRIVPAGSEFLGFDRVGISIDRETGEFALVGAIEEQEYVLDIQTGEVLSPHAEDVSFSIMGFSAGTIEAVDNETGERLLIEGDTIHTLEEVDEPVINRTYFVGFSSAVVGRKLTPAIIREVTGYLVPDVEPTLGYVSGYRAKFDRDHGIERSGAETEQPREIEQGEAEPGPSVKDAIIVPLRMIIGDSVMDLSQARTQFPAIEGLATLAIRHGISPDELRRELNEPTTHASVSYFEAAKKLADGLEAEVLRGESEFTGVNFSSLRTHLDGKIIEADSDKNVTQRRPEGWEGEVWQEESPAGGKRTEIVGPAKVMGASAIAEFGLTVYEAAAHPWYESMAGVHAKVGIWLLGATALIQGGHMLKERWLEYQDKRAQASQPEQPEVDTTPGVLFLGGTLVGATHIIGGVQKYGPEIFGNTPINFVGRRGEVEVYKPDDKPNDQPEQDSEQRGR